MSRVLKYRLNDGSLVTRSGTESPFTIAPLDSELTKVEIVVEDKGVDSPLSNTMYGTPEETTLVPLPPVITSYSGHEDEGIVISFTLPDGGLPYDDLQVRLRTTSGHPDVPLSTLPAQRVNLEKINGKIVGGTFTLMQGDGAGLGTVNTPGEYTISGGYEFYVNSEVRLRLRGVINGNNTPRTDVYIDIEGETLAPPHIIISTRKTWQPERPGSGNWFDIYTNSTGFVKVGNTYRWFYERREYGKKRNTENNGEIQFHEFIDSTTPTDPNSWSSPQQMTYSFPPGVRFNRTAAPDNNHYAHEGGLEVIIPDPTTPGRLVALGKVVGDTFDRTAGKFISTNGGLHWEYIGNAFEGAVTDGNLSLMYDTPNNRWVVYNRARGPASNLVGRWNHSGMPTGTDSNGNRIGRSISRTDRRGVVKIQSTGPNKGDFTDNTLWQPATDGINGTYLILDPASVFNYEDPNNQTLIQTNTTGLHGYPSDRPTRFQYNINSITRKELFDFYHGTAFYDEDLKVYRLFFAVQHRTDERWGAQKELWQEGHRGNNEPFDFTNDLFDQRQYASRLDTEANWRPSGGPFFQVEMRSTDGTNFTFLKDGREEDGLMPSAFNISHIRRQMIPPAPYTQAQYFAGYSPSVVPEPPMMSFASTFLDYNGKKYLALCDSGRAYRHIPDRRQGTEQNPVITSNLILVEIGPASGEDPDPELPAPTITSVTGGINSLIVNGTTNIEDITLLDPIINNISAHVEDGITVNFSVPQGGDGYDSLEVRLYNVSGFPDINIGTLPSNRVHVNTSNGRIVSGTFTILQGDGAGEGTTNSPGQYTVSGGYEFTAGDTFNVRIRGEINGQYTDRTTEQVTVGGQAVPTTPQNFRVTSTTDSSISLAWNSVANADSYELFRNGTFLIQTTSTSYIDSGLASSTSFNYTVRATNVVGESPMSNQITGTTQQEDTPPEPGDWPLYTEPLNTPLSWTPINEVSMTDHAGFAGVRSIGSGNHPSSNPNDWVRFEDDSQWKTLDFVHPKMGLPSRNEYPHFWKVQGGVGTLYGGAYDTQSSDRTSVLGMVSRSRIIGEEWRHNHNDRRRAIYKYLPWANNSRRMNPTLHYDPINKTYVSFFGERIISEPWYGFRCISSAWSTTPHLADSWQYKEDRPLLTHDIVQDIYPDLMEPQYPGNDYDRFARMYPKYSFFHEGKHHLYFEAVIWCTSTSNSETIDFCLATEDYTDHTAWERVDFDYTNIRAERRPHGEGGTGSFWNRRGHRWLDEMTYYDGWYYGVSHASNGTFERGPALYRSRSPLGPFEVYGQADVPLIVSPYGNRNGKGNLILYRDVWFLFCSIRDTTDEQNTPLWDKYAGANVDGDMRVVWGGYYDPLNKINDILNSG